MEIRFYATLRPLVGGRSVQLDAPPTTVGGVLRRLINEYPGLDGKLLDESGGVRRFVAVMLNGRDIRHLEGLETRIEAVSEMDIFPPVAGGEAGDPPAELTAQIAALRDADWTRNVRSGDPRFPPMFIPEGWSLARQAEELLGGGASASQLRQFAALADSLHPIHDEIAAQPLETQLAELAAAASGAAELRLEAVLGRLGWLTEPQLTLAEAGNIIGVTRERMRQLEANALRRIGVGIWLPALDAALDALKQAEPLTLEQAESLLVDRGIAQQPLPPAALDRAVRALRRRRKFNADALGHGVVWFGALPIDPRQIISLGSKRARANGIAGLAALRAELAAGGAKLSLDLLRAFLHSSDRLRLFDESVFWEPNVPEGRDRLYNTVVRMLAATPRQTFDSLLDGLEREYRNRNGSRHGYQTLRVPSRRALAAYLQANPDFTVDGAEVSMRAPRDAAELLGSEELALVNVLRDAPGGALSRSEAADASVARGMNRSTVYVYLTYAPTVEQLADGRFAVRGAFSGGRT